MTEGNMHQLHTGAHIVIECLKKQQLELMFDIQWFRQEPRIKDAIYDPVK